MRELKRYSNRKLYDTTDSRYVTLAHIAALIRRGEEIRVTTHGTAQDITAQVMAQILYEEEKEGPRLSVTGLVNIIRNGLPSEP